MTETIAVKRMVRNLRYKLTYVKIFETYLESENTPGVAALFTQLMDAQKSAIAPLSSYLRRQGVTSQDLLLDDKLMNHALARQDVRARLRFIHDGLERAVAWYRTQLVDKQMTADPELEEMLFELGESDAAKLWRAEAVMNRLHIPVKAREKDWQEPRPIEPGQEESWKPRLVDDLERPNWSGDWSTYRSGVSRPSRKDRSEW